MPLPSFSDIRSKLSSFTGNQVGSTVAFAYCGIVVLGFLKGAITGSGQYSKWSNKRKKITVGSDFYDPIVNNCRDAGVWGANVLLGGFGSAAIVATSPVSVPLMIALKGKEVPAIGDADTSNAEEVD